MDKSILIQYRDLVKEVEDLRRMIQKDELKLKELREMTVIDSVTCGKKGRKPLGTAKVEGPPYAAIAHREKLYERRIKKLKRLETELLELINQVDDYINSIKDSRIRRIMRYRYIDDMNWVQVARRIGKKATADSCRNAHDRYLGLRK